MEAGLPNITGDIGGLTTMAPSGTAAQKQNPTGAFYFLPNGQTGAGALENPAWNMYKNSFNASRANPIYGKSDTVQPKAHIVIFWKRVE